MRLLIIISAALCLTGCVSITERWARRDAEACERLVGQQDRAAYQACLTRMVGYRQAQQM